MEDLVNAKTEEVIVKAGTLLDEPMVKAVEDAEVQSAHGLICEARRSSGTASPVTQHLPWKKSSSAERNKRNAGPEPPAAF